MRSEARMPDGVSLELQPGAMSWGDVEPLEAVVYPPEIMATLPWRDIAWAHADWRVLMRDEAHKVRGHVGIFLRNAKLDGTPVRIGGIGGVMTHPAFRGKGLAQMTLRRAGSFFAAERVAFALLFCEPRLAPFYARLGWRDFTGDVFVEQPGGVVRFTATGAMVLDIVQDAPATGVLDLC